MAFRKALAKATPIRSPAGAGNRAIQDTVTIALRRSSLLHMSLTCSQLPQETVHTHCNLRMVCALTVGGVRWGLTILWRTVRLRRP